MFTQNSFHVVITGGHMHGMRDFRLYGRFTAREVGESILLRLTRDGDVVPCVTVTPVEV